jgi:hypothetical protein
MPTPEAPLLEQLSANSVPYRDPLAVLDWRTLGLDSYWLPAEAVSLYGLPEFDALSDAARIRLSQYELLGIAQTIVAAERLAMEATARRLRGAEPNPEYAFMLHEMREEAGHTLMFLRLASASKLELPHWRTALPRSARPLARLLPNEVLYWFMRVVAQDVPDKLNRYVRRNAGPDVSAFVRQMIALHMMDEARHLAYARRRLDLALSARRRLLAPVVQLLCDRLFNGFIRAFFWPRAELYERAGLGDGQAWRRAALRNKQRREFVLRLVAPTMRLLSQHGVEVRLR